MYGTAKLCQQAAQAFRLEIVLAVAISSAAGIAFCGDAGPDQAGAVVTVAGTVTDIDHQPVPGATVYLIHADDPDGRKRRRSRTDSAGAWSFKLDQEPQADLAVLVRRTGHALGMQVKNIYPFMGPETEVRFGETIEFPIRLGRASRLTLRVVDDQGSAVTGAWLRLSGLSTPDGASSVYWDEARVAELSWATDADGKVTLDDLPASVMVGLLIETPQHGVQRIGFKVGKVADEAIVTVASRLPRGSRIVVGRWHRR